MRRLFLLFIVGLLGLAACAEMSHVPESEMQRTYPRSGFHAYVGRG